MKTTNSKNRRSTMALVAMIAATLVLATASSRQDALAGPVAPSISTLASITNQSQPEAAVGSGFTYQGQLKDGGNPANGQYDFQFRLYDASSGGTQIGSTLTTLNQTVTGGLFTTQLDFGATAYQGQGRWLEIGVKTAGGPSYTILSPRQALNATPFAMSLMPESVITTTTAGGGSTVRVMNGGNGTGLLGSSASGSGVHGTSTSGWGVSGYSASGVAGVAGSSTSSIGVHGSSTSGSGVFGYSSSGDGVDGSSVSGHGGLFRTDAGTPWSALGGVSYGTNGIGVEGRADNGSSAYGVLGASTSGFGVYGQTAGLAPAAGVRGTSTGLNGVGVRGIADNGSTALGVWGSSTGGYGVYGSSTGNHGVAGITASGGTVAGVYGTSSATNGTGVRGQADTGSTASGVYGTSSGGYGAWGNSLTGFGIYGTSGTNWGIKGSGASGVWGESLSGGYGVSGSTTGGASVSGVNGSSTGANGVGVAGLATNGATALGVWGSTTGGRGVYGSASTGVGVYGASNTGWAGYFLGNVEVTGACCAAGMGTYKIDHPADPQGKYLVQAAVQSPDMMSIHNGNVILDAKGEAIVELPDWFEALNHDFRYQFAPIGAPMPNLYVAEEIKGNRFKITGGKAGMKVSWQVTGIRKDPYAQAHPIQVEVEKSADEQGKYLHPIEYGQPESKGINYSERQEMQPVELEKK